MAIGNTYYLNAPRDYAQFLLSDKLAPWQDTATHPAHVLKREQALRGRVFVGITDVLDDITVTYSLLEAA